MEIKFYMRVEGAADDVQSFQEENAVDLVGQVNSRKRIAQDGIEVGSSYWKSIEVGSSLQTLSEDMKPFLDRLSNVDFVGKELVVEVQVVVTYLPDESPVGFFLDAGLISVLAKANASLDIDVVPLISN